MRDSNIHATDHVKSPGEAVSSGAEERETSARSENDVDDKCLNLLNPFSLDVDEEISCTKGGECHDQSPHTNTALAAGATNPMISPTIATSTHAIDSHRNDVYNGVQGCLADTGVLPNSCLEQTIQHEPIEESFYSMSSQKKEKQTTRTKDNDSSPSQNKDIQSSPPEAGGGSPSNRSTDDEVEALKELVDLEPGDLEESQLMVSASLTGDQTAPSTHVQLTPHSAP